MALVQVNNTSLALTFEASQGTLASDAVWFLMEPNQGGISTIGASIETEERSPISANRQRRKGAIVDLDSNVEIEMDLTREAFERIAEGFVFATWRYPHANGADQPEVRSGTNSGTTSFGDNLAAAADPAPAGTDSGFTHDALADPIDTGSLIFTRGFDNSVNNGLHHVIAGSTTTATLIETTVLVDETPGDTANATMEIAGVRAATGDLTWTESTLTLASTTLDFTTLGLTPGQFIHIGGLTAANQFSEGVAIARIVSIAANAIVVDKKVGTLAADDTGASETVDILFGRFLRNVSASSSEFLERFVQWELAMPDLGGVGTDEYEYAEGNASGSLAINIPITSRATLTASFVGTDTPVPTATRRLNAANPLQPVQTTLFNTTSDIGRLRLTEVDETGLTTCIKSMTITLDNQVENEKCLGTLGASNTNHGNFLVNIETQIQFTNSTVASAVRNNDTVTMDAILRNADGGIAIDIPSMTLGDGGKEFPENASLLMNLTGTAFEDPVLGTSIGISTFPVLP